MRFYLKVFLCMIIIETLSLLALGTLLITRNFVNTVDQEVEAALSDLRYARTSVQIALWNNDRNPEFEQISYKADQIALCTNNGDILYSSFPLYDMAWYLELNKYSADDPDIAYLEENDKGSYIKSTGTFDYNGITYVLILQKSTYYIFDMLKTQLETYKVIFLIVLVFSACVLWAVTLFLTRPIKLLSDAAVRITNGNFSERISIKSNDEVGQLGREFNKMSATVQEKILALEQSNEQKDRFIASFAHELKTPLTSIVGYADMIYQQPLDRETANTAAGYILSEGMRLESISLKLMELFLLDKQEFILETMRGDEILHDVIETLRPVSKEKAVNITVTAQDGYVRVENDLFKTLILNLIDNAIKAGAQHISLQGKQDGQKYCFTVIDDGCGMTKEQISHITEEFYMIDKSRSRLQHGVGLGLAICDRIARVHHAELTFESEVGVGTKARVSLILEDELYEE